MCYDFTYVDINVYLIIVYLLFLFPIIYLSFFLLFRVFFV